MGEGERGRGGGVRGGDERRGRGEGKGERNPHYPGTQLRVRLFHTPTPFVNICQQG